MNAIFKCTNSKGTLGVYAGTIEKDVVFFTKDGVDKASVKIINDEGVRATVYLKDTDKRKPVSRLKKAKAVPGSFISFLCAGDEGDNLSAIDWAYDRVWKVTDDKNKEHNIICGMVVNPTKVKDGLFRCSIPIHTYENGVKGTMWYRIAFYDNYGKNPAEIAENKLTNKCRAAIVCGTVTEDNYNGNTSMTAWGSDVFVPMTI